MQVKSNEFVFSAMRFVGRNFQEEKLKQIWIKNTKKSLRTKFDLITKRFYGLIKKGETKQRFQLAQYQIF